MVPRCLGGANCVVQIARIEPRCYNGVPFAFLLQTQAEVEEQQERIKKRRRESAQRSRARKNTYMKSLEVRGVGWC